MLLAAAELAHRTGDWAFLADYGRRLFSAFGTVAAARYAAYGAFNQQRYAESVESVADLQRQSGTLPEDLMLLRALALERQGNPAAREAYDALIAAHPTAENLHRFAGYDSSVGNFAHVVLLGQRLLATESTAEIDLGFVQLCRLQDPDLARRIWRRANSAGVPADPLVPRAFLLALELGLGSETGPLQEPMNRIALAGQHGVEAVPQDQLAERLREVRERSTNIMTLYQRSDACIHLVTAETNATLITTHVQVPRHNAAAGDDDGWDPVYVRHGSRAAEQAPSENVTLYLDITSLLLAADIGILDELRASFDRISIPDTLVPLLGSYRDRLQPTDEDRLRAMERVIELAETRAIEITDEDVDSVAHAQGGIVCDWGRPQETRPIATPRRLVDALLRSGAIGSAAHAAALVSLGNVQEDLGEDPPDRAPIVCAFNTIEMLEEIGVLDILRSRHRIFAERNYINHARSAVRSAREQRELAQWVAGLIESLREPIAQGGIVIIPRPASSEPVSERPEMLEVMTMFATFTVATVICVDDRFVNAYPRRDDGTPIVALSDVVGWLHNQGRLTDERYFSIVHEMRARALLYIPVTTEEIVFHLGRSTDGSRFTPTRELRTLQRYLAFALLDTKGLNGPNTFEPGHGARQAVFLMSSSSAMRGAIREALANGRGDWATWLRDHLRIDGLPGFGTDGFGPCRPQAAIDVEGASYVADLVTTDLASQ